MYALFKTPASEFNSDLLFLEYEYEWEFTGAVAESHSPPSSSLFLWQFM
jgi:hypothetical protein